MIHPTAEQIIIQLRDALRHREQTRQMLMDADTSLEAQADLERAIAAANAYLAIPATLRSADNDLIKRLEIAAIERGLSSDGGFIRDLLEDAAKALARKPRESWQCAARHGTTDLPAYANCDWPGCGCDPAAAKVIECLQERGELSVVPPGWKLVPMEPTPLMKDAGCADAPDTNSGEFCWHDSERLYKAMIAVGPNPRDRP
jgi:hypothetical protein